MVFTNVGAASGRSDDKAVEWVKRVDHPNCQLIHLAPPGKAIFRSLDRKLAAALNSSEVARNELGRRMHQFNEDCLRLQDRTANGRELLWIIFQYYKTGTHAEAMYTMKDLEKVKIIKGNLEQFQNDWDAVLSGLPRPPDPDYQEHCYDEAIHKYSGLSIEICMVRPTA